MTTIDVQVQKENQADLSHLSARVRNQAALRADAKNKPEVKKFEFDNVQTMNHGTKIILPLGMTKKEGVHWLKRQIEMDDQDVQVLEEIESFPLEGAYALMQVLKEIYGWLNPIPTPGFFGSKNPPRFLNLEVGYGQHVQVIWGRFEIPGIEGYLECRATKADNGRFVFVLGGVVKQAYKDDVGAIAQAARDWLKVNSIYRGKAIKLVTDEDGDLEEMSHPSFLDTTKTNESMLIFSDEVRTQVNTHVFTPIERTAECIALGIPLKRSILLEGPFGTGKTMTAHVAAHKAEKNGWTFIYLDKVHALKDTLILARAFAPAIIFAEDIDRALSGNERTVEIDDILNTIDGIDSKNDQTMVILTTNDVKAIEKAMIRPGRLDAIIRVLAPDAAAAERVIRAYAGDLLAADEDLSAASQELDGQIPATIAEVVKRSKLHAIANRHIDAPRNQIRITGQDLYEAARGMKYHLELLSEEVPKDGSPEFRIGAAIGDLLEGRIRESSEIQDTARLVEKIHAHVC